MTFPELLTDFSAKNNLPPVVPDEEGIVEINLRDMHVVIRAFPELDKLLLYGAVGSQPPEGMAELAVIMLKANHLFEGTRGSTLSLDDASGKIYLNHYENLSILDPESFTRALEYFTDTLEIWHDLLADYKPSQDNIKQEIEPPQFTNGFIKA